MTFSSSRFLRASILALIFIFFCSDAPADNSATGIDRMIRQIETQFPVLEGYVLSVKGDRVAIDLKRGQPINKGQILKLIRFGETITHPVSKAIIGREESDLGEIRVTKVRKDYSLARVITPGVNAQKGDGVRSAFKKINIIVAPVESGSGVEGNPQALTMEIEARLNHRLRFEVPAFDLGVWLLENNVKLSSLTRPENLASLRKNIAVDYILLASVRAVKDQTVLQYQLVSSGDGKTVKEARVLIAALPTTAPPAVREQGVQTDLRAGKGLFNFTGKQDFDFELVDFAVGDLTGKGHQDFVIIDEHRVMIYRHRGGQFKKIGQFKLPKGVHRFLSVDVADINGNGRDEIFVTSSLGDRLSSFVLESVPGKKGLSRIWEEENRYFRVLRDFEGPPLLITQKPGFEKPFDPQVHKIHQLHFKNGEYTVGGELPLNTGSYKKLTLYGLAFGHLSPGKTKETIFLDNNYHLRVYSSGDHLLVSSDEYFGHDPRLIEVGLRDLLPGEPPKSESRPYTRLKGRIQLVRHNDRKYVLVPKNHRQGSFLSRLVVIKNSSLVVFDSRREGLKKVFETKKQIGHLAAYQVVDTNIKGRKQVHVASVADHGGFLSRKKISTIYTYAWGR